MSEGKKKRSAQRINSNQAKRNFPVDFFKLRSNSQPSIHIEDTDS
jgi:hypothetical protein